MFSRASLPPKTPCVYLDLDTMVTGDLGKIADLVELIQTQPARHRRLMAFKQLADKDSAAARAASRDPAEIERTVALLVRLPGGTGRVQGDPAKDAIPPVQGSPAEMASMLRALAAEGIGHVQLVVDPITPASLDALAPVLEDLDRG